MVILTFLLCTSTTWCCAAFQPPTLLGVPQQQQQRHRPFTASTATTTQLQVSIGLGPDEKAKADAEAEKQLVPGVDYKVPNHEEHRLDRRSKLDEQCDAWFARLLGDSDSTDGCLQGPIADVVYQQLTQPVELYNEMEFPDPTNSEEWTPYVSHQTAVERPASGLRPRAIRSARAAPQRRGLAPF